MSLERKTTSINMNAYSVIDGVDVAQFYASFDSGSPETMALGRSILDNEKYKANRDAVMADQADFEDAAYAYAESLTAEKTEPEAE